MIRRHNVTFEDKDWELMKSISLEKGVSISKLLCYSLKKTFSDPLQVLLEEERSLYNRLRIIDEKKKPLMEKKNERAIDNISSEKVA